MSRKSLVHLPRKAARNAASPDQDRFRYLIDKIEKAKRARADWDELVVEFKSSHAERIHPLQGTLRQLTRDTVFLIDQLLEQKGWSRVDREALKDIARHTATAMLDVNPNDVEMRTIYDRHSEMSFQEKKQEELEGLKEQAKEYMGIDLDDAEIASEEDLIDRVYERMKEDEARRGERASERPKSKRQERAEASAQNAKQVLREIYRKLASAVHPDREADAARRAEKNDLMQQINRAYATNDLFTLLEAQMRLELIDPNHASKLSSERLRQFNRLLAQQLESATEELRSLQSAFRADYDLPYSRTITARDLHLATQRRARDIRAMIQQQKRFLELLANKSATKRWLKEQRRFDADWDDDEF